MCTSVILRRKNNKWPLIIASNRDEYFNRISKFPSRHWERQTNIIGGLDLKANGTWFAVNDYGLIGCIHNRNFNNDNFFLKRTRGEIILKILNENNSLSAIKTLKNIDTSIYDSFNLIISDYKDSFWIKHEVVGRKLFIDTIPYGLSILTNTDLNDVNQNKIKYYLKKFSKAKIPNPDLDEWSEWEKLLINKKSDNNSSPNESICFDIDNNFGTVSSSIVALSSNKRNIIYRYANRFKKNFIYKEIKLL